MGFKLKDIFSKLGSKANKSGTSFKAPRSGGNIKKEMDWKHGHGEFAGIKKRRKPGESKFQYDVRMKKQGRKTNIDLDPDKDGIPTGIDATPYSHIPEEQRSVNSFTAPTNPDDLTDKSKPQNFGIVPGMSFGEAFAQAGKGGAKAGTNPDTFFWTNPETGETKSFLYDFEKKEEKKQDITDIDMDNIPDYIQGTTRYHK